LTHTIAEVEVNKNRKTLALHASSLCSVSAMIVFFVLACALSVVAQDWRVVRRAAATGANRDFNTVHFANDEHGWVAGDRGVIFHTRDGGTTWTPQTSGVTGDINDIYFRNEEDGFFLVGNRIFATTTGGAVWRERAVFVPGGFGGATPELYSITFANNRRGWIVGSVVRRDTVIDSLILSTSDGGQTWTRQTAPVREELIDLDFAGDERGWVVGSRGTILHTRDGGRSWATQGSGTNATLYGIEFRGRRNGWAVGERGTILRTENGGERWTSVPAPIPSRAPTLLSVRFATDNDGIIVGRGGLILRSNDGGRSWARQETQTTNHIYALAVEGRDFWAVGGAGIVLQYER
jgi:photosystem II stability/assembly factor-like uncharacterized protein